MELEKLIMITLKSIIISLNGLTVDDTQRIKGGLE